MGAVVRACVRRADHIHQSQPPATTGYQRKEEGRGAEAKTKQEFCDGDVIMEREGWDAGALN
jgi:hypothetical protein